MLMSDHTPREIRAKAKRAVALPVMQLDELRWFLSGCAKPPREVAKRTAWRYTCRDDFPAPAGELSTGRVWKTTQVRAWQKKTSAPFNVGRPMESD
jgi:hypothetical protein